MTMIHPSLHLPCSAASGLRRRCFALLLGLLLALPLSAAAVPPVPDLPSLFPQQADLYVEASGLARLDLPAEVLAACRPDLSDLRIFDSREREVPYLVDAGPPLEQGVEVTATRQPELQAVDRGVEKREGAPDVHRERYRLTTPPPAPDGEGWILVLETSRRSLVRRVEVWAVDATGGRRPLVEGGSVFRLEEPLREHLRLPLPPVSEPSLEVLLEGEDDRYLTPGFRFERQRRLPERPPVVAQLTVAGREVGRHVTVLELERPRGLVPDALRIATSTASFSRPVTVWDQGPGSADRPLGHGRLFRLQGVATAEGRELPLRRARGDRLRVVVEDGDSPPLEEVVISVVARQPVLVFSLPAGGEEPAGTLRFGGGRAHPPRYDLASLLPALPVTGAAAERAEVLLDPSRLATARLGPMRPNPRFHAEPLLAFALHPGAPLDPGPFRSRRTLRVPASPEGLHQLTLALGDQATARPDLADLRLTDGEGRQWAYLVERDAELVASKLAVQGPEEGPEGSRYRLSPPTAPVTVEQLVLDSSVPFFDRPFTLTGTLAEDRVLARGRLVRRPRDPRPLTLAFPATRLHTLRLDVDDGSDAALPLDRAEGRFPVSRIYFAAPPGDYELLLGFPEAEAPRYELERVRELVLATAAGPVEAGPLEPNPDFRRTARLASERGAQRTLLWVALALAVIGLGWLTLRLARGEGDSS